MPEEHWNFLHRENWRYDCFGCEEKFPTTDSLNYHLGCPAYKCPFGCGQSFVHRRELTSHEKLCGGKMVTFPPQILDRISYSNFDCYKIYHT